MMPEAGVGGLVALSMLTSVTEGTVDPAAAVAKVAAAFFTTQPSSWPEAAASVSIGSRYVGPGRTFSATGTEEAMSGAGGGPGRAPVEAPTTEETEEDEVRDFAAAWGCSCGCCFCARAADSSAGTGGAIGWWLTGVGALPATISV